MTITSLFAAPQNLHFLPSGLFPYLWIAVNHVFQRTSTNQCFPSSRYVSLKYSFSFREMTKSMNTGYRIYKVNDVIGRVVPEDSAFWDIRVPPVVETWLWLDVGRSESQPERISPNIDVFLLWLSPTEERETPPRPFVIPGKSSEQFVQQCTWDAFPRAGATWPCIYSPTALVLGEWRTIPWRRWHCVLAFSLAAAPQRKTVVGWF